MISPGRLEERINLTLEKRMILNTNFRNIVRKCKTNASAATPNIEGHPNDIHIYLNIHNFADLIDHFMNNV